MVENDQRQEAQIILSGLKFLIDEFGNGVKKLKEEIMESKFVKYLERFVEVNWGVEPEYYTPLRYIETYPEHPWWKHEIEERRRQKQLDEKQITIHSDIVKTNPHNLRPRKRSLDMPTKNYIPIKRTAGFSSSPKMQNSQIKV
ncbi:unnamed protein product [Caenorhabditis angaria]|uniref:Uncharacterized protein n=1 Tax=Caenorhabditis angaria TaxID=860376 RepID=A0A9P1MWZ8_9PELO|nr:unnamed protein product [Caenorhabditis angaria]